MGVRIDNDVALRHEDAEHIAKMLLDYASMMAAKAARPTRQLAVQAMLRRSAADARAHADKIIRSLWSWQDNASSSDDDSDDPLSVMNGDAERDSRALDRMLRGGR